jgi:hypothetical protein
MLAFEGKVAASNPVTAAHKAHGFRIAGSDGFQGEADPPVRRRPAVFVKTGEGESMWASGVDRPSHGREC